MSYFQDDDSSQIRELKDLISELQARLLAQPASVTLQNISPDQNTMNGSTSSARGGGTGTGGGGGTGTTFPILSPINIIGAIVAGTVNIDLSLTTAHIHTMTLGGNISLDFINPPVNTKHIVFEIYIKQDATGGRTVTFLDTLDKTPIIDTAPNAETIIVFQSEDGGVTFDVLQAETITGNPTITDLIIDANKDWLGFEISHIGKLNVRKDNNTAVMELEASHSTPVTGQRIGQLDFIDDDSIGIRTIYSQIRSMIFTPTDTIEDSELFISAMKGGTLTDYIALNKANNDTIKLLKDLELSEPDQKIRSLPFTFRFDIPIGDKYEFTENGILLAQLDEVVGLKMKRRMQGNKGSDIASADKIILGDGNYFHITGTTKINHIDKTGWQAGASVTLQSDGIVTLTNQAGTPINPEADMILAGGTDALMTASDTITLIFDGVFWRETARSVN